jgi:D-alanyl-D-alanine dipeptidase
MPTATLEAANTPSVLDARILSCKQLQAVPVSDNGEPLVRVAAVPELSIEMDELEYPLARAGAWQRLQDAARMLKNKDKRYGLRVWYAYRSLAAQETFFKQQRAVLKEQHPEWNDAELLEQVHLFVAVPDVAGHPTGGAFDVTITLDGEKVDMGCNYPDFDSPVIRTFADGLTETQKKNRLLLREILMGQGFAPFNGEWWHFSYGDREWAAFYSQHGAIYSQVEAPPELCLKRQQGIPTLR